MSVFSKSIASLALEKFESLPQKCKPRTLPNGQREWTPLSAIVISRTAGNLALDSPSHSKVVSLATGTKSLPVSALPNCNGLILHDCHAEILAFRGFNCWLLREMLCILQNVDYCSSWLELVSLHAEAITAVLPFRLKSGVQVSLFTAAAPCGDASMDLLIAEAKLLGNDISPWSEPNASAIPGLPLGRGCFDQLAALRRKPARADAEVSMSKSCTDKIMLKQFTGVLSFPVDLFVQRADLRRVVVYEDQYNSEGYKRSFCADGRLQNVLPSMRDEELAAFRPFDVEVLSEEVRRFDFEKQRAASSVGGKAKASNISVVWVAGSRVEGELVDVDVVEVLVNGVKQGYKQSAEKSGKGSQLCRRKMLEKAMKISQLLDFDNFPFPGPSPTLSLKYSDLKSTVDRLERHRLKALVLDGLGGWPNTLAKDDFVVDLPALSIQSGPS